VESIDHSSNSGECGSNGGSWVPGYADENWAHYNGNTNMFQVGSVNGAGAGATVDYTLFGAGDNTGFNSTDTACSGCAGFASANANWLQGQLAGNSQLSGLDGYIQFLTGREETLHGGLLNQLVSGPLDPSSDHWAGPGGMGPPGGQGDWAATSATDPEPETAAESAARNRTGGGCSAAPRTSTDHYKSSGKERDSESGFDHLTIRA
jgi:hypothetical protein